MSDEILKPNDLAVVIKWPCCGEYLGRIIEVKRLFYVRPERNFKAPCMHCRQKMGPLTWVVFVDEFRGFPREWLKKLPPLSDEEKEKERKEWENSLNQKCLS